jgi:hypothetical protein
MVTGSWGYILSWRNSTFRVLGIQLSWRNSTDMVLWRYAQLEIISVQTGLGEKSKKDTQQTDPEVSYTSPVIPKRKICRFFKYLSYFAHKWFKHYNANNTDAT